MTKRFTCYYALIIFNSLSVKYLNCFVKIRCDTHDALMCLFIVLDMYILIGDCPMFVQGD